MKLEKAHKTSIWLLNIACVVLMIVPYADQMYFIGDDGMGPTDIEWRLTYIWEDLLNFILIVPFYILWGAIQVLSKGVFRSTLKLFALGAAGLAFFIGFLLLCAPLQDIGAWYGTLVLFTFLPLLLLVYWLEYLISTKEVVIDYAEEILDDYESTT